MVSSWMIMSVILLMSTGEIVAIVSSIIGSGGLVTAAVAFYKLRSETNKITVDAAEGAVIVQTGVITSLNSEIKRLKEELEEERKENVELRARLSDVERKLFALTQRTQLIEEHNAVVDDGTN
jgi:predicted RNase H-like nuclease (RuvC/YqgF family)